MRMSAMPEHLGYESRFQVSTMLQGHRVPLDCARAGGFVILFAPRDLSRTCGRRRNDALQSMRTGARCTVARVRGKAGDRYRGCYARSRVRFFVFRPRMGECLETRCRGANQEPWYQPGHCRYGHVIYPLNEQLCDPFLHGSIRLKSSCSWLRPRRIPQANPAP